MTLSHDIDALCRTLAGLGVSSAQIALARQHLHDNPADETRWQTIAAVLREAGNGHAADVVDAHARERFCCPGLDLDWVQAMVERGAEAIDPMPPDIPRLYVSYRRHRDDRWTSHLADALIERGYEVVFDRYLPPPSDKVTAIIARLLTCNVFVPVLTADYRRTAEALEALEWQVAAWLQAMGRLTVIGVWRGGPPPQMETVHDFRDDSAFQVALDAAFAQQLVVVVGVRADGTYRAIGPVRPGEAPDVAAELREYEPFVHVAAVPYQPDLE